MGIMTVLLGLFLLDLYFKPNIDFTGEWVILWYNFGRSRKYLRLWKY